jgi:formylglycine-generating enzyme required for sulfatase activity
MLAGCSTPPAPEPAVPPGMARIPGGLLVRGDVTGVGYRDERPVSSLAVDGFAMDRFEVSWGLWTEVVAWARDRGYEFDMGDDEHAPARPEHPVCNVSWFDAVKWCNARSEKAGRTPVYYTSSDRTEVYRRGQVPLGAEMVLWDAGGFRLPTEAEWEWAGRGGLPGNQYPWPSAGTNYAALMDPRRANFWESGDPWESDADCATWPSEPGSSGEWGGWGGAPNGYGLNNMAGNVAEWCWDWYLDGWYGDPESRRANTRGPPAGYGRVLRGGSWISNPRYCRVSARYMSAPDYRCHCYGFRCVVRLVEQASTQ